MKSLARIVLLSVALGSATALHAESNGSDAFVTWARRAALPLSAGASDDQWQDLEPLGEMIGDATVVALSEGVHAGAEPLEFRNRLFRYLVQKKGFTAIAIESGIVEGRGVHDYVRSGRGDLRSVLEQGLSWTFDRLPQNESLVRWMAEYNRQRGVARNLNFYGFDVAGSPGNPAANRGTETALQEALAYLDRVDSTAAAAFHARLDSLLPRIRFNPKPPADAGYQTLPTSERDAVTAAVADLIALIERKELEYIAASSARDYEWAHRAAIAARQVDGWLRHIPIGWKSSNGRRETWRSVATDIRDRAQADNLDWILAREGTAGKILLFASRYHISTAPISRTGASPDDADRVLRQQVAGTYLRRRLGERLLTIGNLIQQGSIGCAGWSMKLPVAPRETLDGLAAEIARTPFLLDLRDAPAPVSHWLNQQRLLGTDLSVAVGRAFDVLFYLDAVKPACEE